MTTRKTLLLLLLGSVTFSFPNCTTIPDPPTTEVLCTFTITEPKDYNCYIDQAGTGRKIKMFINVVTKYIDPNSNTSNTIGWDDKSIIIDPSATPFPVTITARVPINSSSLSVIDVNMEGVECSTCANGYSLPTETPYGQCPSTIITTTTPWSYRAAKPRWSGTRTLRNPPATLTVNPLERIPNVPNSCGCTVN